MRILIVDDHAMFREGLKRILVDEFKDATFGEAANATEALAQVWNKPWELVLLDVSMHGRSGLDVLKEIRASASKVPVLVLSAHPEEQYAVRVLKSGAAGYLTKEGAPQELCRAVRKVVSRGKYLTASVAEQLAAEVQTSSRPAHERLGARVGKVLQRYKMGKLVHWHLEAGRLQWQWDQDKLAAEARFDGGYIVSSDVPVEQMAKAELVAAYKKLTLVETAFRNLKTVQLEVRPVYHKLDDRIRSHVFLCTLAYYLQWHLTQRLQPLFAADGRHKHRQWTLQSVLHRLGAFVGKKSPWAGWNSSRSRPPRPISWRSCGCSRCAWSKV